MKEIITYEGIHLLYLNVTNTTNGTSCASIADQSTFAIVLGIFLVVASFLSYTPQWIEIIWSKSSIGLSIYSIGFGNFGSWLSLWNAILLQWDLFGCCEHWSVTKCQFHLLSIYQISVPAIGQFIILHLFLIYYDRAKQEKTPYASMRSFYFSLATYFTNMIIFMMAPIGVSAALVVELGYRSSVINIWAKVLGITSAVITICQWAPQIYKTYVAKDKGVLSIYMLLIQFPGSLLVTYFQAFSFHTDVSTWLPYFMSAIQQGILLALCLYFSYKNRNKKKDEAEEKLLTTETPDGETPNGEKPTTPYPNEGINTEAN